MADRIEIVHRGGVWLVSDQRHVPRRFLSSHEAVAMAILEAKRLAAAGIEVEVHLWNGPSNEVVFRSPTSSPDVEG